jgi:hypothetical protein
MLKSPKDEHLKSQSLQISTMISLCFINDQKGVKFVESKHSSGETVSLKGYFKMGEYVLLIESFYKTASFSYLVHSVTELLNLGKEVPNFKNYGTLTVVGESSVAI